MPRITTQLEKSLSRGACIAVKLAKCGSNFRSIRELVKRCLTTEWMEALCIWYMIKLAQSIDRDLNLRCNCANAPWAYTQFVGNKTFVNTMNIKWPEFLLSYGYRLFVIYFYYLYTLFPLWINKWYNKLMKTETVFHISCSIFFTVPCTKKILHLHTHLNNSSAALDTCISAKVFCVNTLLFTGIDKAFI